MICPNCNSANTRKKSVIYDEGTYSSTSTSNVRGSGASATSTTTSSGQSKLARKCSPPQKMSVIGYFLFIFLLFFIGQMIVLAFWNPDNHDLIAKGVTALGGVLALLGARGSFMFNRKEYPKLMDSWNRSWCCLKCGNLYETEE